MGEFWHVLEACTNARHAELLASINAHLEKLSRRVEAAVEARFEVRSGYRVQGGGRGARCC